MNWILYSNYVFQLMSKQAYCTLEDQFQTQNSEIQSIISVFSPHKWKASLIYFLKIKKSQKIIQVKLQNKVISQKNLPTVITTSYYNLNMYCIAIWITFISQWLVNDIYFSVSNNKWFVVRPQSYIKAVRKVSTHTSKNIYCKGYCSLKIFSLVFEIMNNELMFQLSDLQSTTFYWSPNHIEIIKTYSS